MTSERASSAFDCDACRAWYGQQARQQDSALKQSCCSPLPPRYVADVLRAMNPAWFNDFRGHGYPLPPALAGCKVAVVGCDTGRDVLLAAALVGASGTVVGIDWREDRLARAQQALEEARCPATEQDGAPSLSIVGSNVECHVGYPDMLSDLGLEAASFDLVVANCVLSGSYDGTRTLAQIQGLLKPCGELVFTDIVCQLQQATYPVEGYSFFMQGQMEQVSKAAGWHGFRIISREDVHLGTPRDASFALPFELVCGRAFKGEAPVLEGMTGGRPKEPQGQKPEGEPGGAPGSASEGAPGSALGGVPGSASEGVPDGMPEERPFTVTYAMPMAENKRYFDFDEEYRFILGRPKPVDALTACLLMESRYGQYFSCKGEDDHD